MFSYVFMKILEARPASYDRLLERASRGRVRGARREVAARIPVGSHVLEVGCGTGELALALAREGSTVEAFDANRAMVAEARKRLREAGLEEPEVARGTPRRARGATRPEARLRTADGIWRAGGRGTRRCGHCRERPPSARRTGTAKNS